MLRIVEALARYLFDIAELQHWWDEWDRRQNPVAFWLAVVVGGGLLIGALSWAYSLWQRLAGNGDL